MKVEADAASDVLAADNTQQMVAIVKEWPILLVDGDDKRSADSSSLFLERALMPERTTPFTELDPAEIDGPGKPAVVVLADVPHLADAQIEAIDRFLAQGGGLFILAGERVADAKALYNERLYRNGEGWLPVKLAEVASAADGVKPDPRKFQHPALDALRSWPEPSLREVSFRKWWRTSSEPDNRASVIGRLSNGDPFLIEKPYKNGRVILCTVPPDRRWNSTLPKVGEFLILVHEISYYLAGNRDAAAKANPDEPLDPRESDLTRCSDDDWRKVRDRLPVAWQEETAGEPSIAPPETHREELWWLLLLAVIGLLCSEVWMTRRMALARGR
jgi:hypothetical protein